MRRLYAGETHTARSLTGACSGPSLAELLSVPALTQIKYDRPAPGRAKNFKCESSRTVQFLHERHQCFQQHRSYRRAGEIRDLENEEQSQQTRRIWILCNLIYFCSGWVQTKVSSSKIKQLSETGDAFRKQCSKVYCYMILIYCFLTALQYSI